MQITNQLARFINPALTFFASSVLTVLVVVITYQIGSRYLLGSTPSWTSEIAILMMGWLSFIGIVIGLRDNTHMSVTLFAKRFPLYVQTLFSYISIAGMFGFGVLMVIYGSEFTVQAAGSTMSSTGLPRSLLYGIMPLSGLFIIFYCVDQLIHLLIRKEPTDDR